MTNMMKAFTTFFTILAVTISNIGLANEPEWEQLDDETFTAVIAEIESTTKKDLPPALVVYNQSTSELIEIRTFYELADFFTAALADAAPDFNHENTSCLQLLYPQNDACTLCIALRVINNSIKLNVNQVYNHLLDNDNIFVTILRKYFIEYTGNSEYTNSAMEQLVFNTFSTYPDE